MKLPMSVLSRPLQLFELRGSSTDATKERAKRGPKGVFTVGRGMSWDVVGSGGALLLRFADTSGWHLGCTWSYVAWAVLEAEASAFAGHDSRLQDLWTRTLRGAGLSYWARVNLLSKLQRVPLVGAWQS